MIGKQFVFSLAGIMFFCGCETHITPSEVPEPVRKAFDAKYSGATDVEWEKEGAKIEAEFKLSGKEIEAEFNPDGGFIREE